ncbi:MAG: hypothetical protein MUC97_12880, partial [Bernardetiaceae bacterium]|nr:hypothetical protein [Bernardetiaceae bacterium]
MTRLSHWFSQLLSFRPVWLGLALGLSICPAQAQTFRVEGTRILDPTGREFLIKGVNVNGPH